MKSLKPFILATALFLSLASFVYAQDSQAIIRNRAYQGAEAIQPRYRAIYQLDSNAPATIEKAIRNINNVLQDPRLKEKIEIELIAFSGGTEAYLKNGKYEPALKSLIDQGVIVAQCLNSLKERKLKKEELYDFIAYVPSGNGELVIRSAQGWTIIKP
ncbi:DsrE family protein [Olivibacter sp. 47]|uniref:DsrE family protein n=1 Tax=Olivibacter sp. 47 TaxID=3056486 RepID=UPI0025A487DF|nr:DsrE family protein [Olivibacter sp. 47]MDM8176450.1 DsrE family protein [Olivibacter sp. 47]